VLVELRREQLLENRAVRACGQGDGGRHGLYDSVP
jgi:hypothetical protein